MSYVQMEERHQSVPNNHAPRRRDAMSPPGPFGGARTLVRTIGRAAMVQAYELGQMASVVTMASLHLVGGGTDSEFGALQRVQGRQQEISDTMETIELDRIKSTQAKPPHYGP